MTLYEYLTNPAGKGAAFANIPQQKKVLDEQYAKLESKIEYKMYLFRKHVIYHVIVPSKDEKTNNTYDVIIEVPLNNVPGDEVTIDNAEFTAFSNCPSFVFTYANIFYSKKMLCTWLIQKYNPEVRKNFPNSRNQYGVISIERSLYLALRFIKVKGLDVINLINTSATKIGTYSQVAQYVRSQNDIMDQYKKAKLPGASNGKNTKFKKTQESEKDKRKAHKEEKKNKRSDINSTVKSRTTKSVKSTSKTKKTKTTKSTKKF